MTIENLVKLKKANNIYRTWLENAIMCHNVIFHQRKMCLHDWNFVPFCRRPTIIFLCACAIIFFFTLPLLYIRLYALLLFFFSRYLLLSAVCRKNYWNFCVTLKCDLTWCHFCHMKPVRVVYRWQYSGENEILAINRLTPGADAHQIQFSDIALWWASHYDCLLLSHFNQINGL